MEICGIPIKSTFSTNEFDEYYEVLKEQYYIIGVIDGHLKRGKINNPIWIINENSVMYLLMLCKGNDLFTKLCVESYQKILDFEKEKNNNKKIIWNSNEYIYGNVYKTGLLNMHQVIMNHYRKGGDLSVDHIDRNPLNNILSNLRIATRVEQNNNQKGVIPGTKRERQHQARELPEGILQEDMPKYINYNLKIWDKEKNKVRDFFRIERHPLLDPKVWEGTKSMKVSIQDKLKQIKKILQDLDNGILPKYIERDLPKHVYFTSIRGENSLVYDNRNTKHTKKMRIKDVLFDINNPEKREKQVYIFNHRIMKTYGEDENILSEDYEYFGEPIEEKEMDESQIQLPKYISLFNDRGNTILAYQRVVKKERWSKKIKLPNNYTNIEEVSPELLEDIEKILPILNIEIIKKYGKDNSIIELSKEKIEEITENIEEEKQCGFPMYARIQEFQNGEYLVFNKIIDKKRMNTTIKLPDNYNKNKELHILNEKIIKLYGKENELDLTNYPYEYVAKTLHIPNDMFIILTCKIPYIFIKNNDTIIKHILPKEYDIQKEIDIFDKNRYSYTPITNETYYLYINSYINWKPKHISLTLKNDKPVILYKNKGENFSHYLVVYFSSNENINIYKYLIEINNKIIERYGKEYSIFFQVNG